MDGERADQGERERERESIPFAPSSATIYFAFIYLHIDFNSQLLLFHLPSSFALLLGSWLIKWSIYRWPTTTASRHEMSAAGGGEMTSRPHLSLEKVQQRERKRKSDTTVCVICFLHIKSVHQQHQQHQHQHQSVIREGITYQKEDRAQGESAASPS